MDIITAAQTILAIFLIVAILLQRRGSGLSGAFGGENNAYATRRGAEKVLFTATIIVVILFFAVSVARFIF